ncbi:protocadherin beta-14 [Biomphalaria pfeifferi]|uniref:Protocadherin beta-14 n=1 Tax=Biomphalaria pfeifferi TaxID=112525 RepID=A0AAD8FF82_BIOPF|nr:protocadherin beta-14 [Biomphalaria pfeifferi]
MSYNILETSTLDDQSFIHAIYRMVTTPMVTTPVVPTTVVTTLVVTTLVVTTPVVTTSVVTTPVVTTSVVTTLVVTILMVTTPVVTTSVVTTPVVTTLVVTTLVVTTAVVTTAVVTTPVYHVYFGLVSFYISLLDESKYLKYNFSNHEYHQDSTLISCALRAPTDDHQSDTSGETTTSDSGRGGSEEDIQLPPLPELTEDTSRMIFRNPGAGLKDSRFIQSDYADYGDREVIAFETFSPRTLPVSDRRDKGVYGGREVQTMAHTGRPHNDKLRHGRHAGYPQGPQSLQGSPHHPAQQKSLSNDSYWSQPSTASSFGPGNYPDDIPERSEPGSGKKVTFQTGLTTQNLKTWDLAQKMNLQPELSSIRSVPSGYTSSTTNHQRPYGARPKSQDDDDNTTTSGSYTINPENDFDDGLPVPSFSVA